MRTKRRSKPHGMTDHVIYTEQPAAAVPPCLLNASEFSCAADPSTKSVISPPRHW